MKSYSALNINIKSCRDNKNKNIKSFSDKNKNIKSYPDKNKNIKSYPDKNKNINHIQIRIKI